MTPIRFVVYGVPVPKGSMRAFLPKGSTRPIVTDSNRSVKPWTVAVKTAAVEARQRNPEAYIADGPVGLEATFYLPCPKSAPKRQPAFPAKRPDLDKLVRVVADALTGVLWQDDAQVTSLVAKKRYAGRQDDAAALPLPRPVRTGLRRRQPRRRRNLNARVAIPRAEIVVWGAA